MENNFEMENFANKKAGKNRRFCKKVIISKVFALTCAAAVPAKLLLSPPNNLPNGTHTTLMYEKSLRAKSIIKALCS